MAAARPGRRAAELPTDGLHRAVPRSPIGIFVLMLVLVAAIRAACNALGVPLPTIGADGDGFTTIAMPGGGAAPEEAAVVEDAASCDATAFEEDGGAPAGVGGPDARDDGRTWTDLERVTAAADDRTCGGAVVALAACVPLVRPAEMCADPACAAAVAAARVLRETCAADWRSGPGRGLDCAPCCADPQSASPAVPFTHARQVIRDAAAELTQIEDEMGAIAAQLAELSSSSSPEEEHSELGSSTTRPGGRVDAGAISYPRELIAERERLAKRKWEVMATRTNARSALQQVRLFRRHFQPRSARF